MKIEDLSLKEAIEKTINDYLKNNNIEYDTTITEYKILVIHINLNNINLISKTVFKSDGFKKN